LSLSAGFAVQVSGNSGPVSSVATSVAGDWEKNSVGDGLIFKAKACSEDDSAGKVRANRL
jgi:hypothetical protein